MKLWNFMKYKMLPAISYKQLAFYQSKLSQKICSGHLMLHYGNTDFGGMIGYLACIISGSVVAFVPQEENENDVCKKIQDYKPEYIWIAQEKLLYLPKHIKKNFYTIYVFAGYCLLKSVFKAEKIKKTDLTMLLPTSGSTGNSKMVRISEKNIISNTKSICTYLNLKEDDRAIISLPLSYAYGISVVNTLLYVGGSIVFTKSNMMQMSFWNLIKKINVTFFAGVPFSYECMKKIKVHEMDLSNLRILTQAGGKLGNQQHKFWGEYAAKNKKKFYVMYGQTEATARISYLPPEKNMDKIGSVGIPIPNSKIWISDIDKQMILEPYKEGEIVCEGDNISLGYAENRRDLELPNTNNGRLFTGDIGYFDEEGFLYICGRKKRIAKIFGKRIDLSDMERKVYSILAEETVILTDDSQIYIYTDAEVSDMQIKQILNYFPFSVNLIQFCKMAELPRKTTGKIDYCGLKK